MASLSPNTIAINTIAHNLANAADAVAALDVAISEELRALIRLANAEVARVRKAARKAAATAKRAAAAASIAVEPKQPARRGRKPKAKVEAVAVVEFPAVIDVVAEAVETRAEKVKAAPIEIPSEALEISAVIATAAPKARGRRRKTVANGVTAH
jgi:hypothetical protein